MFESLENLPAYPLAAGVPSGARDGEDMLPLMLLLCGDNELMKAILLMLLA